MRVGYVKETCNASLKQFAINIEDEKGRFDIMLVANMEKEHIDHITMRSCLEYISMRYLSFLLFGPTEVCVSEPARRSLFNMSQDTFVKSLRKKMTLSARKNLHL